MLIKPIVPALAASLLLSGCVGMAIETATDAAIAVGKIPFKVGGAVVDVVTPDSDENKDEEKSEK
ncbi:MAG: NF038104 family lipoprotein [Gammaproteobacteria bacterium]|nr:NF038104 family lipoprotein [Gammaproteobacteria bacterium]NNF66302.1 hypothetical protein [Gammaproteobacteria bacterium]